MGELAKIDTGTAAAQRLHRGADIALPKRLGIIVLIVCFGGIGSWAAFAPLSGAVIAPGVVKVDTNRKTLQHLEGGIVGEILVRDGDHVRAGQALIVLVDQKVSATMEVLEGQLEAALAKGARLETERSNADTIKYPVELLARRARPQVQTLIDGETSFFNAKRERLQNQLTLLQEQRGKVGDEIAGFRQQVKAEEAAITLLQEEIAAYDEMEKNKFVERTRLLIMRRTLEDYRARQGEHLAEIARASQKSTDLQLRATNFQADYIQLAADELTQVQAEIFDLEERVRPSRDAMTRQQITAPIPGTVVGLSVHTVGGVIRPGDPILDIVPDNNPLIIEARLDVTSIDEVVLNQDAEVRLSAYKARNTPLLLGRVIYVSADRLMDQNSEIPYYIAHVEINPESLAEASHLRMSAGMPAEVYIKTSQRTAFDYLLDPITAYLRKSFRDT